MNLHKDKDAFLDLIAATAENIGLPDVHIEKDYWVTRALHRLAHDDANEQAVFKGGTSLSKAHGIIQRFSEDIDIAVFARHIGDARRKKMIKRVEAALVCPEFEALDDDARVSKKSNFRKTVYRYPRLLPEGSFGQASPQLLLEINAFTTPEPSERLPVRSEIAKMLAEAGRDDLIARYGLEPFDVRVLSVQRTLTEKLIAVAADSYHEDPIARLRVRIRHLYDIAMILRDPKYRAFIGGVEFAPLYARCADDDEGMPGNRPWHGKPLGQAPLFASFEDWWPQLASTYENDFASLVYGERPSGDEIHRALKLVFENSLVRHSNS